MQSTPVCAVAIGSMGAEGETTRPFRFRTRTWLASRSYDPTVRTICPSGLNAGPEAVPSILTGQPGCTPDRPMALIRVTSGVCSRPLVQVTP